MKIDLPPGSKILLQGNATGLSLSLDTKRMPDKAWKNTTVKPLRTGIRQERQLLLFSSFLNYGVVRIDPAKSFNVSYKITIRY
jgi:hypothetical protein